jgi:hypothetical protein
MPSIPTPNRVLRRTTLRTCWWWWWWLDARGICAVQGCLILRSPTGAMRGAPAVIRKVPGRVEKLAASLGGCDGCVNTQHSGPKGPVFRPVLVAQAFHEVT